MKKILLVFILNYAFYFQSFSQINTPSDSCSNAPKLCINGYITSMSGFTPGKEPIVCQNGQQWGVHNDLWIAFVPSLSTLEITIDVIGNCNIGGGIQALIHDNCETDPIDCDVDCGGSPSVGAGLTFIPGNTYYLRIDGCNGAICPIQITVYPANAIEPQIGNPIPKLDSLIGSETIPCVNDKLYKYCASLFESATTYIWKIESGDATIIDNGDSTVDNEPNNPGKNISFSSKNRNCAYLSFQKSGSVLLSVQGSNGCQTSEKVFKTIKIEDYTSADSIVYAYVCPYQKSYQNYLFSDNTFLPNDTCNKFNEYKVVLKDTTCNKNIKLLVGKICDTLNYNVDLGNINICNGGYLKISDKYINSSGKFINVYPQNIKIDSVGKKCPSVYSGNIIPLLLFPKIQGDRIKYKCNNETITLIGDLQGSYYNNVSIFYTWEKYNEKSAFWETFSFSQNSNQLQTDKNGIYRLYIEARIKYIFQSDTFTNDYCKSTYYCDEIQILNKPFNEFPSVYTKQQGGCIGDTIKFALFNKNIIYKYLWIDSKGNIINSDTFVTTLTNKNDTIYYRTVADCNFDKEIIINSGSNVIDKNIELIGNNTGCTSHPIYLKLMNYDTLDFVDWENNNAYKINKFKDSISIIFDSSGTFSLPFQISNNCTNIELNKTFNIEQSVPKINIRGPKTAIEKTTQTYCINNPNNNNINWTTSKNLKYKVSSTNKQSCIYVTFPKGINVGWIKSTISNNCSNESDSVLIVSKPKLGNSEIEQWNEDSNNINNRATQSEEIEFSVFPNPATNTIEVRGNQPYDQIEILDVLGKSILIDNISNKFDISELNAGFYILKIISNKKVLAKNTFIKID